MCSNNKKITKRLKTSSPIKVELKAVTLNTSNFKFLGVQKTINALFLGFEFLCSGFEECEKEILRSKLTI